MTEIMFIGDPHFQAKNIQEVELFIKNITIQANDRNPDLIIIGGDLLHDHERLHTTPLNKCYEFINNMRNIAKTYVLVGNHDYIQNQQYLTQNHWMNSMKEWENVIIVDKVNYELINDNLFVFVPYVPNGRFIDALNTIGDKWHNCKCIFAHQEFYGCKMGAFLSEDGDKWPDDYPNVISGHIHCKQKPQKNIYYSGSSLQHSFGENTNKIIPFLTFYKDKKNYDLEELDLKLPRKKTFYLDVEDIDSYKIKETRDKIKITVSGNYEQFKALKKTKKYKSIIKSGTKIVFKSNKLENVNKLEKLNIDDSSNSFDFILKELIDKENDKYLKHMYKQICKN